MWVERGHILYGDRLAIGLSGRSRADGTFDVLLADGGIEGGQMGGR